MQSLATSHCNLHTTSLSHCRVQAQFLCSRLANSQMLRGLPGAARVLKGLNATRARGLGPAGFVPAHRLRSTAAENSSAAVTTSQSFPASPPWQRVKYAELEVWDSAELVALSAHLVSERARLHEVYRVAKLEQRKVAAAERRRKPLAHHHLDSPAPPRPPGPASSGALEGRPIRPTPVRPSRGLDRDHEAGHAAHVVERWRSRSVQAYNVRALVESTTLEG